MSDETRTETRTAETTVEVTEEGSGGDVIVKTAKGDQRAKVGSKFADEVMRIARESGLKNFRVILGDNEVSKSNAPDTVQSGMSIRLEPYDLAA